MKGVSGKPLKKTRSNFVLQKNQSSMQQQQQQIDPNNNNKLGVVGGELWGGDMEKKSPRGGVGVGVEFPISPQLMYGEEMVHFSHPRHPLSRICLPDLFTCSGCKEYGAGNRFSCQQCDFQLHDFCALSPPALKAHPFHSHHQLLFYSKPVKGGIMQSKCDVCAKPIKGFGFRCGVCSFQMHPCCAMLSVEMKLPSVHQHSLRMMQMQTQTQGEGLVCGECKRRRSGRVYGCTVCDYRVHAVCAKSTKNGLRDNGHKGTEKPSVMGTAARLVSQVVVEFLGGIIEGLGEGVGEALVQNIKGKGAAAAPSPSPPPQNHLHPPP